MNKEVVQAGVDLANEFTNKIRDMNKPFYEKGYLSDKTPEDRKEFCSYILGICALISAHEINALTNDVDVTVILDLYLEALRKALIIRLKSEKETMQ